ncbi:MAG: hypothetical protein KC593_06290 [Myxococcales bacterium]|nr:hypothetical protein [Myxococcales bacterium]MCB9629277.1 hypothetical protein [Sandaracinaceae bacterium]
MSATHYRPPQTIAPLGFLLGGVAAVACGLLLAPIYSLAIAYIPIVYLNAILTAGTGGLIGFATASALRAGHFQHTALSYVSVLGALLFGYWMHWVAWIAVLAWRADIDFEVLYLLFPPALLEIIGSVYDEGTWTVRGSNPVSGVALGVVWFIEAVIFFGVGLFAAIAVIGTGTFCERCKAWCTELTTRRLAYDDTGALADAVNERQEWALLARPEPEEGAAMWHTVSVHQCPRCRETGTLTLCTVTVTHDDKGKEQHNMEVDADRVFIAPADVSALLG